MVTYGRTSSSVLNVAKRLHDEGNAVSVLKMDRVRPLPKGVISEALRYYRILFFEEGSLHGGVGEFFGSRLVQRGYARQYKIIAIDQFIDTCKTEEGLEQFHLDENGIYQAIIEE